MVYVVIYDISDDKRRAKIAKYLEGKGQRIQESAFECRASEPEILEIASRLGRWVETAGNVRIYPVCRSCMEKSIGVGQVREIVGKKGYAIF